MSEPEKGFYYHYKHTSDGLPYNYTYEVIGIGWHTEEESKLVIYRPLYENRSYLQGADFATRPLSMWNEHITKDGKTLLRFTRITDVRVIRELESVRDRIYKGA